MDDESQGGNMVIMRPDVCPACFERERMKPETTLEARHYPLPVAREGIAPLIRTATGFTCGK